MSPGGCGVGWDGMRRETPDDVVRGSGWVSRDERMRW